MSLCPRLAAVTCAGTYDYATNPCGNDEEPVGDDVECTSDAASCNEATCCTASSSGECPGKAHCPGILCGSDAGGRWIDLARPPDAPVPSWVRRVSRFLITMTGVRRCRLCPRLAAVTCAGTYDYASNPCGNGEEPVGDDVECTSDAASCNEATCCTASSSGECPGKAHCPGILRGSDVGGRWIDLARPPDAPVPPWMRAGPRRRLVSGVPGVRRYLESGRDGTAVAMRVSNSGGSPCSCRRFRQVVVSKSECIHMSIHHRLSTGHFKTHGANDVQSRTAQTRRAMSNEFPESPAGG